MDLQLRNSAAPAIIDEPDMPKASEFNWYVTTLGYVRSTTEPRVWLHRLILGDKVGFVVDHANGNKLDNRRSNLRHATRSQSQCNRRPPKSNKSGFAGIRFFKGKWEARITVNRQPYWLGSFLTLGEALKARRKGSDKYHGEFARKVNFGY